MSLNRYNLYITSNVFHSTSNSINNSIFTRSLKQALALQLNHFHQSTNQYNGRYSAHLYLRDCPRWQASHRLLWHCRWLHWSW